MNESIASKTKQPKRVYESAISKATGNEKVEDQTLDNTYFRVHEPLSVVAMLRILGDAIDAINRI